MRWHTYLAHAVVFSAVSGYVTGAPVPNWLGLATPEGRDAVQLADGCDSMSPGTNVIVYDDGALQALDPIRGPVAQVCAVVQRVHMSDVPCAQNAAGACDVAFS
jgi:hypothetical protein